MMTVNPARQTSVAALVTANSDRARVLERFGIDYCCHGRRTLAEACAEKGLDVEEVRRELAKCDERPAIGERDWLAMPLTELARHIVDVHHAFLRREMPRLKGMLERVNAAHGTNHPELCDVKRIFAGLETELTFHMMKEERVLFPLIGQLEGSAPNGSDLPAFHCGSILNPIGVMEDEHEQAGEALAMMRSLTAGYIAPAGACPTYIALLAGLAELEEDLHSHIHKENNVLFPRAAVLEARLRENHAHVG